MVEEGGWLVVTPGISPISAIFLSSVQICISFTWQAMIMPAMKETVQPSSNLSRLSH